MSTDAAQRRRSARRSTSPRSTCCRWSLLVVFAVMKLPPFLSILGSALFAAILAPFTAVGRRRRRSSTTRASGRVATAHQGRIYAAMATGFVSHSGVHARSTTLFSRGGMASLLTTIWLVLGALSFAAIMEHAGFLERLLEPIVARARAARVADRRGQRAAGSA